MPPISDMRQKMQRVRRSPPGTSEDSSHEDLNERSVILAAAHSMLQFHRKFSTESVSSERRRCYRCWRDADGDGMLPTADAARGPWQRTPAGNGGINMILAPVSRGRAGGGDEGGGRSGGLRHHPSRLLLLSPCAHRPLCAPAARSMPFDPAAVRLDSIFCHLCG